MTTSMFSPETVTRSEMKQLVQEANLRHVAFIMDGNRRWAQDKHLPKVMGHHLGVETLKSLVRYAGEIGLEAMTVYAFSTENWNRDVEEVGALMQLFLQALSKELDALHANQVRLRFIGDLTPLPADLRRLMEQAMAKTAANTGLKFQVATNYGSRAELVQAARNLAQAVQAGELTLDEITEERFANQLYTAGLPDPDLLVRTGGESRWSNYLLWQCAYAEFYVTPLMWPEFSVTEMNRAIWEFVQRERRFGC